MENKLKDHREIGRELDLFSFHGVVPGAVFWHPKGLTIYKLLVEFIRDRLNQEGYTEISTPIMVKSELFQKSGHWDFYHPHMFNFVHEDETYSLKPMNCPGACLIFASQTRSYHDLPLRYSDFGVLHRNELSGVLGGLFRVRQFTIDDTHHFVRPDQIQDEIKKLLLLIFDVYKTFGFKPEFFLATKPDKAMGTPQLWQEAEKDLRDALGNSKARYGIKEKDGAFYGPKIDIHIKDSQGRDWQLATIQLDFQIPQQMKLSYTDHDGKPKQPIIIHRAILGSIERFIGILLEHYQGNFPLWLSPVQVTVIPITDKQIDYARSVYNELKTHNFRATLDDRAETMQAKIRDATLQKIPYQVIIGDREVKQNNLSVRTREGKDLGQQTLDEFNKRLRREVEKNL